MAISLNSLSFPPAYALRRTGLVEGDAVFVFGQGGFFEDFTLEGADYALCTWKPVPARGLGHYSRIIDNSLITSLFSVSAYSSLPSSASSVSLGSRLLVRYDAPDPNQSAGLAELNAFMRSFVPQLDGGFIFSKRSSFVSATARGNAATPKADLIYLNTPLDMAFVGVSVPLVVGSRVFLSTSGSHYRVLAPYPAFNANDPPVDTDYVTATGFTVSTSGSTIIASWASGDFQDSYYLYGATSNPITLRSLSTTAPRAISVGMLIPSYLSESYRFQDTSQTGTRKSDEMTDILQDSSLLYPDLGSFWMQRGQVLENFYGTIETYTIG